MLFPNFYRFKNFESYREALFKKDENFWIKEGAKTALNIFHQAAEHVPAYKDFLRKNKINHSRIKTLKDFKKVPFVDKKNYLKYYSLEKLCWGGNIAKLDVISVSSGSSGEPFFWPRHQAHGREAALSHEIFLTDSFEMDKNSTLFLISFGMGMWVAGTLTYSCLENLASKYPLNVIAPGINAEEILKIVQNLGPKYDQIVIAGYPPFVKDVLDEGKKHGVNWGKYKMKFLFAAEGFSEDWRDYVYKIAGCSNPCKDSLNIYGTADALILGHETPLSIMIRRLARQNSALYKKIFGSISRVATLVQYNPVLRFFEDIRGKLIFTASSGIPLIRYDIGDEGRILRFGEMIDILRGSNTDMYKESNRVSINVWQLPFLYVLGRRDFTAFLYGVNIYPEGIRAALEKSEASRSVSGKFLMLVKNDAKLNPHLEVNVELKKGFSSDVSKANKLKKLLKQSIIKTLRKSNSEYHKLYEAIGRKAEPRIKLYPHGYEEFFKTGVKQQWTKKIS